MLEAKLHLVETFDEAQEFVGWLGERRPVLAIDTETGGLDWWREPLRLVQFGDAQSGWVLSWERWGGLVADAVNRYTGRWVLQNAKFDWHFLRANGVYLPRHACDDTLLMGHLIDPGTSNRLKDMAQVYVDPSADDGETELKMAFARHRWNWRTIPWDFPTYWHYAGLDAVLTARLWEALKPAVQPYAWVYDLELAVAQIIMDAEIRGARVDLPYSAEQALVMQKRVEEMDEQITERFGVTKPGSNTQLIRRFQQDGVVFTKRTKKGAVALDEEVLQSLNHPLAPLVLERREAEKLGGTYFEAFNDMADGEMLHCSIHTTGARTGRMSCTRPNLQNLPRSATVRDAFIPREGNELLLVDYDQIEMRIMAAASGDPAMLEAIRQGDIAGDDFHTASARAIYGLGPDDPLPREQRQITKNAGFAKVFCSGVEKFAATAGIDILTATAFLDDYDARFPGIKKFQNKVIDAVWTRAQESFGDGWVMSAVGRRHPCPPNLAYKAVNYYIQGTAADVLKVRLRDLDAAGLLEYFVLPVHDEYVFDVPLTEIDDVAREVSRVASVAAHEGPWYLATKLSVSADRAMRWGDKYREVA